MASPHLYAYEAYNTKLVYMTQILLVKLTDLSRISYTLIVLMYTLLIIAVLSCTSSHAQSSDRAFYITTGIERGWGISKLGEVRVFFDFSGVYIPIQSYRLEAGYRLNKFHFGLLYREGKNQNRGSFISLDDLDRYWQLGAIVRYGFVKPIGNSPILWGTNVGIAPGLFNYSYLAEQGTSGNNQSTVLIQEKTQRVGIYADVSIPIIGVQIKSLKILAAPAVYMDLNSALINAGFTGSLSIQYTF